MSKYPLEPNSRLMCIGERRSKAEMTVPQDPFWPKLNLSVLYEIMVNMNYLQNIEHYLRNNLAFYVYCLLYSIPSSSIFIIKT